MENSLKVSQSTGTCTIGHSPPLPPTAFRNIETRTGAPAATLDYGVALRITTACPKKGGEESLQPGPAGPEAGQSALSSSCLNRCLPILPFYFSGTLVNCGGFLKCPVVQAQLRSLGFPLFLFLVRAGHQGDSYAGSKGKGAAVRLQLPQVIVTASQTPLHGRGSPTSSWLLLLLGQVCVQFPQDTDTTRIRHRDRHGCQSSSWLQLILASSDPIFSICPLTFVFSTLRPPSPDA